jgi:acetyltransferase-like isoleucine patch superfamily enzyme
MKNKIKDKSFSPKPSIVFFGFLLKIIFYSLSLIFPLYLVFLSFKTNFFLFFISILFGVFLYLIFLIFVSSFILKILPLPLEGEYKLSSKEAYSYLFRGEIYRTLLSSPLITLVLGDIFLYNIFYRLMGLRTNGIFIIAENTTKILDPWYTEIGENSIISGNCLISSHIIDNNKLLISKVKIGSRSLIGYGAVVAPGSIIENNATLGAFSVTKKFTKIPSNEIWYGFPAKKKKLKKS